MQKTEYVELNICAGIVVFHPDRKRLLTNMMQVLRQVNWLILFCNERDSYDWLEEVRHDADDPEGIILPPIDGENHGIAYACNRIVEEGSRRGSAWCLLLDQDSSIPDNMILRYEEYLRDMDPKVAMLTPRICDLRNRIEVSEDGDPKNVRFAITSGSLVNTSVWEEVGGYREDYFIDLVDQEYCARLHRKGFFIHRLDDLILSHELGTVTKQEAEAEENSDKPQDGTFQNITKKSRLKLKDPYSYSAFRRYYITRNRIWIAHEYPEYAEFHHPYLKALKRAMGVLLYEDDKKNKLYAILRGIHDARKSL